MINKTEYMLKNTRRTKAEIIEKYNALVTSHNDLCECRKDDKQKHYQSFKELDKKYAATKNNLEDLLNKANKETTAARNAKVNIAEELIIAQETIDTLQAQKRTLIKLVDITQQTLSIIADKLSGEE